MKNLNLSLTAALLVLVAACSGEGDASLGKDNGNLNSAGNAGAAGQAAAGAGGQTAGSAGAAGSADPQACVKMGGSCQSPDLPCSDGKTWAGYGLCGSQDNNSCCVPSGAAGSAGASPGACTSDAECGAGQACVDGVCKAAVPNAELCNGIDDDLDGLIDDGTTCPAGLSCVNGSCQATTACASDADCADGLACVGGTCQLAPSGESCNGVDDDGDGQIDEGATCPAGQSCQNGVCQADAPAAELCNGVDDDGDGTIDEGALCPSGQLCEGGACVQSSSPCASDADCAAGQLCFNGSCQEITACSSNADCAAGQSCVDGACKPGVPTVELCNGIDDDLDGLIDDGTTCPAGLSCVNGSCQATTACASDADCADGLACVGGTCQLAPSGESCNGVDDDGDGQIDEGATCPAGQSCKSGSCVAATPCASDADCVLGQQVCVSGFCEADVPTVELCNGIDDDKDGQVDEGTTCPAGQSCVGGNCKPTQACASDVDCANGQICKDSVCTLP